MNLSTEAERHAAFKKEYGDHPELFIPQAGFMGVGFTLITFDPETKYAQFHQKYTTHNYAEFIEFAKNPDATPIKRERYYVQNQTLLSAELSYPLNNHYVCWTFMYDGNNRTTVPHVALDLYSSEKRLVLLARCRYIDGSNIPTRMEVTSGNLENAIRNKRNLAPSRQSDVPGAITIQKMGDGERYSVIFDRSPRDVVLALPQNNVVSSILQMVTSGLPGDLYVMPSKEGVSVTRCNMADHNELTLVAPKIDYLDWQRLLTGNWQDYVSIPKRFPVVFDF